MEENIQKVRPEELEETEESLSPSLKEIVLVYGHVENKFQGQEMEWPRSKKQQKQRRMKWMFREEIVSGNQVGQGQGSYEMNNIHCIYQHRAIDNLPQIMG